MTKNIKERDEAISQNEKRIFQLKQQNHELEKFKFVLDYKIKELREEMGMGLNISSATLIIPIEPREERLAANREQMRAMESELLNAQRRQQMSNEVLSDHKAKVDVLQRELAAAKYNIKHPVLLTVD